MALSNNLAYIVSRVHDLLKRDQPILFAQAAAGSTEWSLSVETQLGPFWMRLVNDVGRIHTVVAAVNGGVVVTLLHVEDGDLIEIEPDPDKIKVIINELSPMLERALVLDELAGIPED